MVCPQSWRGPMITVKNFLGITQYDIYYHQLREYTTIRSVGIMGRSTDVLDILESHPCTCIDLVADGVEIPVEVIDLLHSLRPDHN